MACYCPCIRCFNCNDYGHVTADCLTKFCHQTYQQDTEIPTLTQEGVIDPHLEITIAIGTITVTVKIGIGLAGPNPIPTATDTGVTVAVTHEEVTLDPISDPHATVPCHRSSSTYHY